MQLLKASFPNCYTNSCSYHKSCSPIASDPKLQPPSLGKYQSEIYVSLCFNCKQFKRTHSQLGNWHFMLLLNEILLQHESHTAIQWHELCYGKKTLGSFIYWWFEDTLLFKNSNGHMAGKEFYGSGFCSGAMRPSEPQARCLRHPSTVCFPNLGNTFSQVWL